MTNCKLNLSECTNLVLRTAKGGAFDGQRFFGCTHYPSCSNIISVHFDENLISEKQEKLANAFNLFVRSNYFIYATFGVVYFNLRQAEFMDYLLRSEIIVTNDLSNNIEIGLTGAKIFRDLFYHLYLIPCPDTKIYLINNFPKTFSNLTTNNVVTGFFSEGIDYINHTVDEDFFRPYSDIETYNK